jgi:hypothetical protein
VKFKGGCTSPRYGDSDDDEDEDDDTPEYTYVTWVPDNGEIPAMENDGHQFEDADDEYVQYQRTRIGFLTNPDPEAGGDEEEEEEAPGEAVGGVPEEIEKAIYAALHARHGASWLDRGTHLVVTLTAGLGGVALLVFSGSPIVNVGGVLLLFSAMLKMLKGS